MDLLLVFKQTLQNPAGSDTYDVTNFGGVEVTAQFKAETKVTPGELVNFKFDTSKISYFDPKNGNRLN